MSGYRARIELLHWVRTGEADPRGALAFYARLAELPVDYVEKRARGEVDPSDGDFARIDDVWHAHPPSRHRWRMVGGIGRAVGHRRSRGPSPQHGELEWRCSRCRATLRGERRTAQLMLSRCPRGQMTAHQRVQFA